MKSFPKSLTAEEEAYYLSRFREGDMDAKRILIERNLRLVAHVARKYVNQGEETEDLIAVGTVGLIKAVVTFNHQKNSKLATYAARCVENELLMLFRNRRKVNRDVSIYDPIGTDKEGNEINLLDILESESVDVIEQIQVRENTRKLEKFLHSELTMRERQILQMRYGLGKEKEMTQREIAGVLGISRSYVSRIEKTAIEKLREKFQEEISGA